MPRNPRAVVRDANQGNNAPVESLEGRLLLSGAGHDDGHFKFHPHAVQRDQAVADFNGDKKADVATLTSVNARKFGAGFVVVQLGQGDGTFKASALKVTSAKASAIVAGDFNKDGKQDLALVGVDNKSSKTQVTVLLGDGAGKFTAQATQTVGMLPLTNLTAADLDADGDADLVSFSDTKVYAAINNGDGTFLPAVQQDNPLPAGVPAAVGDIDGDGKAELIGVTGDGLIGSRWFTGQSQFLLTFPINLTSTIPLADSRIALGDVNGDAKPDLIALGDGSVNVALQTTQPGQDLTFGAWVATTDADVNPDKTLVGDVDGDGKADLVTPPSHLSTMTRAKLVLISNGDGTFHKLVPQGNTKGHGHGDGDDDDQGGDDRD